MTSLSYEEIFNSFLGYIDDLNLANMSYDDAYSIMTEYLHKSVAKPFLRKVFTTLSLDDEIQELKYEVDTTVDDEADLEFVRDILSKSMVIEWIQPQVKSRTNLAQFFGGKEQKMFSQAQHLSELRNILETTYLEVRKMIRDRSYIYNSYLGD